MSTASTVAIIDAIRLRLLSYTPLAGPDLLSLLGSSSTSAGSDGHVFIDRAPDDLPRGSKWIVLETSFNRGGADGGLLRSGRCEVTLHGHGRQTQADLEDAADVIEQAWRRWIDTPDVLIARDPTSRLNVPFTNAPDFVDRERVVIRLTLPFVVAPTFLF